jgi:hypothetical protein
LELATFIALDRIRAAVVGPSGVSGRCDCKHPHEYFDGQDAQERDP